MLPPTPIIYPIGSDPLFLSLQAFMDEVQQYVGLKIYFAMPNLRFPQGAIANAVAQRLWLNMTLEDLNVKYEVSDSEYLLGGKLQYGNFNTRGILAI